MNWSWNKMAVTQTEGSEAVVQNPALSQLPPKPPDLNLHAVTSGIPSYGRKVSECFQEG